jgi:lariat debranching enzyme
MKVAVVGCGHGKLDEIYESCERVGVTHGIGVDLLIICGDFQAVRNQHDLECLACPPKYREMNQFHEYYHGSKVAPITTLFIGGNHEASNHLLEVFHGGWVAPNICRYCECSCDIYLYSLHSAAHAKSHDQNATLHTTDYMGMASVLNFGGVRIGGLSGIFKPGHDKLGHYECPPFDNSSMRSIYHCREYDAFRLLQVTRPLDIALSHDWPRGIAQHGDVARLLQKKAFLRDEIANNSLGNPLAERILHELQPKYWFSAHMHVKFAAVVRHGAGAEAAGGAAAGGGAGVTKFLALGKCLPSQDFLQLVDFPDAVGEKVLSYDEEWLAILKSTAPLMSLQKAQWRQPTRQQPAAGGRHDFRATEEEVAWVRERAAATPDGLRVPTTFERTVPPYHPSVKFRPDREFNQSPQTLALLRFLDLPDVMSQRFNGEAGIAHLTPSSEATSAEPTPEEAAAATATAVAPAVTDDGQIDLGEFDEDEL